MLLGGRHETRVTLSHPAPAGPPSLVTLQASGEDGKGGLTLLAILIDSDSRLSQGDDHLQQSSHVHSESL